MGHHSSVNQGSGSQSEPESPSDNVSDDRALDTSSVSESQNSDSASQGSDSTRSGAKNKDSKSKDSKSKDSKSKESKHPILDFVREVGIILLIACVLSGVINNFVAKQYYIPSGSMEPLLVEQDRILVDRMAYKFGDVQQGDVIVFKGPAGWEGNWTSPRSDVPFVRFLQNVGSVIGVAAPDENDLVKRVIAVGGQTVQCQKGDPGIMVDGKKMDDHYTTNGRYAGYPLLSFLDRDGSLECGGAFFGPVTVHKGFVWVMGDNRFNSADSRYHMDAPDGGQVPVDNIRGKVRLVVWPISNWQRVPQYTYASAHIASNKTVDTPAA